MVSSAVANVILTAATRQLQLSNQLFAGRNLVLDKFGEELTKQLNSTASQHSLTTAPNSGTRPITFLAGSAESTMASNGTNSTSKSNAKRKTNRGISGAIQKTNLPQRK